MGIMDIDLPPKLVAYLDESRAPLPPITGPDDLLQLESLTLIRLVAFLEAELGIRLDDEELSIENFETVRTLAALVGKKRSPGSGDA